ncbi:hypothetical protein RN001_005874 [Aquatica leii]|uniref:Mutator-like transposase domain-containing protein n=1 Tax=Aquatica leii TaxID=1421715 RepID=A0AAN7SS53_9COLE|nr:hypothetical protein RN001_005874 [Aquatica leii]
MQKENIEDVPNEISNKKIVLPNDINPVPELKKKSGTRGRKGGQAKIVTSTPNKEELEESLNLSTQKVKRKVFGTSCHFNKAGPSNTKSKMGTQQKEPVDFPSSESEVDLVFNDSSDEDTPLNFVSEKPTKEDVECIFCQERFSTSRSREIWGQNYESTSSHTANRSFAKEYIGDALIADADLGKNAESYQDIALWPDSVDNELCRNAIPNGPCEESGQTRSITPPSSVLPQFDTSPEKCDIQVLQHTTKTYSKIVTSTECAARLCLIYEIIKWVARSQGCFKTLGLSHLVDVFSDNGIDDLEVLRELVVNKEIFDVMCPLVGNQLKIKAKLKNTTANLLQEETGSFKSHMIKKKYPECADKIFDSFEEVFDQLKSLRLKNLSTSDSMLLEVANSAEASINSKHFLMQINDSFILHVKLPADVDEAIESRKKIDNALSIIILEGPNYQSIRNIYLRIIQKWIKYYNEDGYKGLKNRPRASKPFAISNEQLEEIRQFLTDSPRNVENTFKTNLNQTVSHLSTLTSDSAAHSAKYDTDVFVDDSSISENSHTDDSQIDNCISADDTFRSDNSNSDSDKSSDFEDISFEREVGTKPPFTISGRRIIDISYFLGQLKSLKHKGYDCSFFDMNLVSEKIEGMQSILSFKCQVCNIVKTVRTEDLDSKINSNLLSVLSAISSGIGYSQLSEVFAAMDIPSMSHKTYSKYHNDLSPVIHKKYENLMKTAGKEEALLAIHGGSINDDGTPIISVVVDGAWSKRSYRTNYNALSGVACITGAKTKKLLYVGVRNKYCYVCARSDKSIKDHDCFKNWNSSSTAMEADIIVEGFQKSLEMHNLIYGKVIGDGDSSVYRKLIAAAPYGPTFIIEKIECRNHLLRNYLNKLAEIAKESSFPPALRKKVTNTDVLGRFRNSVTKAIEYRKQTSDSFFEKANRLKHDILNGPKHILGDHDACENYFCKKKSLEENLVPDLQTSGLYDVVATINMRLANNAVSLLHDVDTNSAETFNSIVAKFVGGKQINFSLKGSYETRCIAAAVSYNTFGDFIGNIIKELCGTNVGCHLEKYRLQKFKTRETRKKEKYTKRRRFATTDLDYGPKASNLIADMEEDLHYNINQLCCNSTIYLSPNNGLHDYHKTKSKLRQAEETSDIQSQIDVQVVESQSRRLPPRKLYDSSDDENISNNNLPRPPLLKNSVLNSNSSSKHKDTSLERFVVNERQTITASKDTQVNEGLAHRNVDKGRNWSYQDLEKMDYREYENLIIEEIPCDPESEVGGYESSEEDGEPDNAQHFLNQSVDIQAPANDNFVYDSNEDFSDEDLIPLSEIQAELNRNKFVWRHQVVNYITPADFSEECGPETFLKVSNSYRCVSMFISRHFI